MLHRCLGAGLLLAAVVIFPNGAAGQVDKKPITSPVDAEKLGPGDFTGTVLTTPGTDRSFTVRVLYQTVVLNPNAAKSTNPGVRNLLRLQNQINHLQNQMARSKRPNQQLVKIQQLAAQMQVQAARVQANLYRTVPATQDVDFQAADDTKVRKVNLPPKYDEKGNPVKYTTDELKEFKGKDTKLPGYESTIGELQVGQVVTITLAVPKPAPGSSPSKPAEKKDKEENKDLDKDKDKGKSDPEKKLQVRLILIVKDDAATADAKPRK
jgi:hypothetical protein